MSEVQIKPLNWRKSGNQHGHYWQGQGVMGSLEYVCDVGPDGERDGFYSRLGHFDTLEQAQAAAQADYEARIRSALLPDVSGMAKPGAWQPIETAPKDGTIVDLLTKDGVRVTDEWWKEDDGEGFWSCLLPDDEFTHWMPLPAPPLQTEGK